jgi:hypothetical protein
MQRVDIIKSVVEMADSNQLTLTETQLLYARATVAHGGDTDAAASLGVDKKTVYNANNASLFKANLQGFYPAHGLKGAMPEGMSIDRLTVQYGHDKKTGEQRVTQYWAKGKRNDADYLASFFEALSSKHEPAKPIKTPTLTDETLLTQYTITDYHIGMLACGAETGGQDWDTSIATKTLLSWFEYAMDVSPDSDTAVFCQLGDFLHYDSMKALTPASGHVLDADTRFFKLVDTALYIVRVIIDKLLKKHKKVVVLLAEGNHDEVSSIWLRKAFKMHYANEPRVEIIDSNSPYYYVSFGSVALFYHHGHKKPMAGVDKVFCANFPTVFGNSVYRYAHMGHYHHDKKNETELMTVEQHRTLAASDAYAARGGYVSLRDAKVIIYNKEYGEVMRHTINPKMLGVA